MGLLNTGSGTCNNNSSCYSCIPCNSSGEKFIVMFEYKVNVTRVVDGDTVDADIDLGFDIIYKERIRLFGIDTPESRTRNKKEKVLGLASKERLKELCKQHKGSLILRTTKDGKGKFGRILGSLIPEGSGITINDMLVAEGHARPYFGGKKGEVGEWVAECDDKFWRWTMDGYVEITE